MQGNRDAHLRGQRGQVYDTGRGRRQQWGPNQRTAGEDNNEDDDQRDDNDNKETTKNDVPATAWDEMQDTSKGKEPDEKLAYQVPLPNKPANCDEAAKLGYLRWQEKANAFSRPSFIRMPLHMALLWMLTTTFQGQADVEKEYMQAKQVDTKFLSVLGCYGRGQQPSNKLCAVKPCLKL